MIPLRQLGGFFRDAWKHPKVRRASGAALAFAGVDLLILAAFWMPAAWEHHRLEKALEDDRNAKLEASQAREFVLGYVRLSRLAEILEAKWKTPVTQAGLVESLTRTAALHRLKVLSQDFDEKSLPEGGTALEQNLSLSGDYASLREFLGSLESLPTLTVVSQARLERVGSSGGKVQATLLLLTYQKSPGGA
jgi:hypothetical protein